MSETKLPFNPMALAVVKQVVIDYRDAFDDDKHAVQDADAALKILDDAQAALRRAEQLNGEPPQQIVATRYAEIVRKVYDSDTRPIKVRWGDSYWFALVNTVLDELGMRVIEDGTIQAESEPSPRARFLLAWHKLECSNEFQLTEAEIDALVEALS